MGFPNSGFLQTAASGAFGFCDFVFGQIFGKLLKFKIDSPVLLTPGSHNFGNRGVMHAFPKF